jgi:ketosteroid isomerase-like protein
MDDRETVLRANEAFYQAFEGRDLAGMALLWAQSADDCCIHPGWEVVRGFRGVMQSWRSIFSTGVPMRFRITDVHVSVEGDVARVHNVENIYVGDSKEPLGRVAVTHIWLRRGAGWALALHHGSPIATDEPSTLPSDDADYH